MRRILVTGMSGTGKSSALAELAGRGFRTVDTDDGGWSEWSESDGGYVWVEDRIEALLARRDGPTLFVSGTVSNQGRFYPRFDAVVLLSAPRDVLLRRIGARTTNDYGKSAAEHDLVLRDLEEVEPLLRATCTHEVDATMPLDVVVDQLSEIGLGSGAVPRISYDEGTAAAYKAVREIPRDGLSEWREAVRRHLRPSRAMTLVDIGAGTGQFAAAFSDWFGLNVLAVEPSAAMRDQIPRRPSVHALEGSATSLPLEDESADAAWLSLVIHHIRDLEVAAREIRRVLRPGATVLVRQGFPGRLDGVELVRWFPETARVVDAYPSVMDTCAAFAAAGFRQVALEQVRETYAGSLADFLDQADTFRRADTTMRELTDDEFLRGKERLRRAVGTATPEPRSNRLDLLVLR